MTRRGLRATHAARLSHPRCPFGHRCTAAGQPQPAALRSRVPAQVDRREPHMHRERERDERASTRGYGPDHLITLLCSSAGSLSLHPAGDVSTRRAFGPLPRSRPTGRGKRHATILGAARGHGDRTFAGACVCGARAAQVPLPRALEIRFPMRPHLVARFESGRDPARSRKLGDGTEKERRCLDSGCRGGVAWRYPPIRRDTIPCHASPAWHEYTTGGSGYPILGPGVRTVVHARRHAVRHDADV